jgi:uncharacterized repeat protein (TIGR03803 family)
MRKLFLISFFIFSFSFFTSYCSAQYTDLYNFNSTTGGLVPHGSLTLSGTTLYGLTYGGAANGDGCIFSFNTSGNGYTDMFDFDFTNGAYPDGSLILSGTTLYGMTKNGGASNEGCIFSFDTNGNVYTDLFNFDGTNGAHPIGSLILSGTTLYGMTEGGGDDSVGVIFSLHYTTPLSINEAKANTEQINVYPNPSSGIFTVAFSHAELVSASQTIWVYNMLGEQVLTETLSSAQGDNLIDISGEPNGVYLYRVIDNTGNLLGEGKVIVQK